jgi:hypothetical protein
MKQIFNPEKWHPMAFKSEKQNCPFFNVKTSSLFLFAEPGCLVSERISSYISCLPNPESLKITFLFPSEKDFLTDIIDHNTQKKYDLKTESSHGKPLLIDALGRPQKIDMLIDELKKKLYDVEIESEAMIKKKAITRFCEWYFETNRELFLFMFEDNQ